MSRDKSFVEEYGPIPTSEKTQADELQMMNYRVWCRAWEVCLGEKNREPSPPKGYEDCFGSYGPVLTDNGAVIAWGFPLVRRIGEERFNRLNNMACRSMGDWVHVVKHLSPKGAVKKYGRVEEIHLGPKGGWRHVRYGDQVFYDRSMDPRGVLEDLPKPTWEESEVRLKLYKGRKDGRFVVVVAKSKQKVADLLGRRLNDIRHEWSEFKPRSRGLWSPGDPDCVEKARENPGTFIQFCD